MSKDLRQPHQFQLDTNDTGQDIPLCICGLPEDIPSMHPTTSKDEMIIQKIIDRGGGHNLGERYWITEGFQAGSLAKQKEVVEWVEKNSKEDTTGKDLREGTYQCGDNEYREGYNQALSDLLNHLGKEV